MQHQLVNAISNISLNNENYDYTELTLDISSHMYSSTKQSRWRLLIDGVYLSQKDKHRIEYKCLTCESFNEVSALRFLRKLNSTNLLYCYTCRNQNEVKRNEHSQFMTGKDIRNLPQKDVPKILSHVELHATGIDNFSKMDTSFQEHYIECHLTEYEMNMVLSHLISLRNGQISNDRLQKCVYWPIFPCSNQMKFTSVFYDPERNEVLKLDQPIMRCEECHCQWKAKNLHKFKNCKKILCKDCCLCRKVFKIRGYDTQLGERVTYQSRQEKAFLEWCDEKGVDVRNGPNIPYMFGDTNHTYKVDFAIPKLGFLIEVKDNHIWHRQQVASGKWDAKIEGVANYIKNNNCYCKFLLLTPQSKNNIYQEILSKLNKI